MPATQQINPLQISYAKSWSGLTTDNHLSAIFAQEPQLVSSIVSQVFSRERYEGLEAMLNRFPAIEMETDMEYRWKLKGDDRKAVNIVSYTSVDLSRPGLGNSIFRIELDERFFEMTDYLIFDDREFAVRVASEPFANGVNWIYEVQIIENDLTLFIPPSLLQQGKQISKLYSPQEQTLNKTYGGTSFTSPFDMANIFSTLGKKYVVPGNMHDRPMIISLTDPKTKKTTNVWTRYQEMVVNYQWALEKAENLVYSKFNRFANGTFAVKGSSGFPIMQGAGLRQQIAPAYKFFYSNFTIGFLLSVLTDISINTLPEDKREFVLLTGERGMIQFHEAVQNNVALFQPIGFGPSQRVTGSGQNLGFGGQYRSYMGPQGVKITVMRMPQYDDPVNNRTPHPKGGFTENYRYTVLNFGTTEGEPNIQRVYPKGRKELMWYVPGSTTPFGPNTSMNSMGASAVDGYEVYKFATQGIMIKNPMTCCELIYASQP